MIKNILITGIPKSGKSTILRNIISNEENKVGFVTNEILKDGERIGFELESYDGKKNILSHVDFKTDVKVSKYFVDLEKVVEILPLVEKYEDCDLLYIDEVGQMQLYSDEFKLLVQKFLDSNNICIMTLSKVFLSDFIEEIKTRDDVILVDINEKNRSGAENFVKLLLSKIRKAIRYSSDKDRFSIDSDLVTVRTDHGVRLLKKVDNKWNCSCDFFYDNGICSHLIALDEYFRKI